MNKEDEMIFLTDDEISAQAKISVENRVMDATNFVKETWGNEDPNLVLSVTQIFATEWQTIALREDLAGIAERLNRLGNDLENIKKSL